MFSSVILSMISSYGSPATPSGGNPTVTRAATFEASESGTFNTITTSTTFDVLPGDIVFALFKSPNTGTWYAGCGGLEMKPATRRTIATRYDMQMFYKEITKAATGISVSFWCANSDYRGIRGAVYRPSTGALLYDGEHFGSAEFATAVDTAAFSTTGAGVVFTCLHGYYDVGSGAATYSFEPGYDPTGPGDQFSRTAEKFTSAPLSGEVISSSTNFANYLMGIGGAAKTGGVVGADNEIELISVVPVTVGTAASPGNINVTVPAGAEGVVAIWDAWADVTAAGLLSITSSFTATKFAVMDTDQSSARNNLGFASARVSATGAQTITPVWDFTSTQGRVFILLFFKNIHPASWVVGYGLGRATSTAQIQTINVPGDSTNASNYLIHYQAKDETDNNLIPPNTQDGFVSIATGAVNFFQYRVSRANVVVQPNTVISTQNPVSFNQLLGVSLRGKGGTAPSYPYVTESFQVSTVTQDIATRPTIGVPHQWFKWREVTAGNLVENSNGYAVLTPSTTDVYYAIDEMPSSLDVKLELLIRPNPLSADWGGPLWRMQDGTTGTNYGVYATGNVMYLVKRVSGTLTQLGSVSYATSGTGRLLITVTHIGNNITATVQDVSSLTNYTINATDSAITTNGYVGFNAYGLSASTEWRTFTVTSL